jgi:hypothetical protein
MTNWSPLIFSRKVSISSISLLLPHFWLKLSPLRLKQLVTSRKWGECLNKHKTQGHEAQHWGRNLPPTGAVTKMCVAH